MTTPTTETIDRRGSGTGSDDSDTTSADQTPFAWDDLAGGLRAGEGTCWLSVRSSSGVHTRPLFAAWSGTSFIFASKASAAKTKHLESDGNVSLAVHLGEVHLVVEGVAARLVGPGDLERASTALREVYDWPTTVVGDELDAPYAAPTSGGPPFRAYEITPSRAWAFPAADQAAPTRFVW